MGRLLMSLYSRACADDVLKTTMFQIADGGDNSAA
jgi:hypothetical protein